MPIYRFLILISIINITSCRVSENNFVGTYSMNKVPQTTFTFYPDKTFNFIRINPNPYLHPFEHKDEYYFITSGKIKFVKRRKIELISRNDSILYPLITFDKIEPKTDSISTFQFIDVNGDKVKILYVKINNNSIVSAMHRSMESFNSNLKNGDVLEFYFYGYPPYKFVNDRNGFHDYTISIRPFFKPNYFLHREFKVRKNRLRDLKNDISFKKYKSGI